MSLVVTLACSLLLAGFSLVAAPAVASAAAPAHTDVMFVFDTSGSMGSVLEEAKSEIQQVMTQLGASLPDAQFGLAEVRDYGGSEYDADVEDQPWKLDVPVTSDVSAVTEGINGLEAFGGGDGPEAYGRALWETDTNPEVGWRSGARHVIVLVADQVPHDFDLDEGVPESAWVVPPPWDTGEELPGTWGIPDTQLKEGEKLAFRNVLSQLASDGKPLEMVDYHDTEGDFLGYWEQWAPLAGGQALEAGEDGKELAGKLVSLAEQGALGGLPSCAPGESRNLDEVCVADATVLTSTYKMPTISLPSTTTKSLGKTARLQVEGSATPTLMETATLGSPSASPASTPLSVGLRSSLPGGGSFEIDLNPFTDAASAPGLSGGVQPLVSADPPLSQLPHLENPKLPSIKGAWIVIPLGGFSRSYTLNLLNFQPLVFNASMAYEADFAAELDKLQTEAAAIAAGVVLYGPELEAELVAVAVPVLVSLGVEITPATILDIVKQAYQDIVVPAIEDAPELVVATVSSSVSGAAKHSWNVLTGLAKHASREAAISSATAEQLIEPSSASLANVRPLRLGDLKGLHAQLLSGALASAARASLVTLTSNVVVRPLVASRRFPRAGRAITLLGGRLRGRTAQLVISGPGYRAVRDVRISHGVAGARVVLPTALRAGRWYAGILDYSGLHLSHARVGGSQVLEAATWLVR